MDRFESPTERMWRRFKDDLSGYLRRRLPTTQDADDVLQDVFHRIHRSSDRLAEVDSARGWLYTIARRAVADFYRTRERTATHAAVPLDDEDFEDASAGVAYGAGRYAGSQDVHEEVLSWLRPMIDELPEMYAVPLRMADVDGRSQQDVADELGLSLSGAKSRIQRARGLLGEALGRCCEVEFGSDGRASEFRRLQPAAYPCLADHCV